MQLHVRLYSTPLHLPHQQCGHWQIAAPDAWHRTRPLTNKGLGPQSYSIPTKHASAVTTVLVDHDGNNPAGDHTACTIKQLPQTWFTIQQCALLSTPGVLTNATTHTGPPRPPCVKLQLTAASR
jgi:hypothetical protein